MLFLQTDFNFSKALAFGIVVVLVLSEKSDFGGFSFVVY